jgi:hypothetical protein
MRACWQAPEVAQDFRPLLPVSSSIFICPSYASEGGQLSCRWVANRICSFVETPVN